MTLKELKLSGFKSFAGNTRLVFDQGVTGVIGPNGSGKSNVADGIRWVLGEQSTKTLRGAGGTDVIFAGSGTKSRRNMASVELTFDNDSGRFPLEAGEVTLTRQVDRSGQSNYLVNGEPVKLIDLISMLTESGVGPKSYAVISQGTVDRYLTATPADRRELFDEATGVKALKLKLSKAQRTMERAGQKVHELTALLNELKPRLKVLKRQVELQQKREVLKQQHKQLQQQWYRQELARIEQHFKQTEQRAKESAGKLKSAREAREQVETNVLAAIEPETGEPVVLGKKTLGVIDVHQLLKRCQELLLVIVKGEKLEANELRQLLSDVDQAVEVYDAKTSKAAQPKKSQRQEELKAAMGDARDMELEAERHHSTNQANLKQAQETYDSLISEIKRELGAIWLESYESDGQNAPVQDESFEVEYGEVQKTAAELAAIGEIDPLALKEYEEVSVRYQTMSAQLRDAQETYVNTEKLIRQLQVDITKKFNEQLRVISKYFSDYFKRLFGGGKAEIEATEEGVDLLVDPPNKKLQHVNALSGGEKALTSLSLLLAIVKVQQPPFMVLDEVDAALDEANSERFVDVIQELANNTQIIIITHNRATMSQASVLYGVTMNADSASEVYSVKLDEIND